MISSGHDGLCRNADKRSAIITGCRIALCVLVSLITFARQTIHLYHQASLVLVFGVYFSGLDDILFTDRCVFTAV